MKREWTRIVSGLERDRESGASLLAERALTALAEAWETPAATPAMLAEFSRALRGARPSMPVIANVVNRAMLAAIEAPGAQAAAVREVHAQVREARGGAARRGAELARGTVITLSASQTVTKALRAAARAGRLARVIVAESRPGLEGRQTAKTLASEGVEVTVVADAALGLHVREADCAIVGADAVLADGSIVNKIGTYLLALASAEAETPVYAVADTYKVSSATEIPLEEKDRAGLWPRAPSGLRVRNIYFDRTPGELVAGIATDRALLKPEGVAAVARETSAWSRWETALAKTTRAPPDSSGNRPRTSL